MEIVWNRITAVGLLVSTLSMGGCALGMPRDGQPEPHSGACADVAGEYDQKVWTGGGLFGSSPLTSVSWPGSGDWKDSVEHWCVHNDQPDATPDFAMHVLVGVESNLGKTASFDLKRRPGTEGATLRLEYGFAFITFRWPLIWMESIDAGSIGTTAIGRRHGDSIQTFLIRNARQAETTMLTTDCDTALEIDSGSLYAAEDLAFEPGSTRHIIMCQHNKVQNSEYFEPQGTGSGQDFTRDLWYFAVAVGAEGALVVTPEDSADPVAVEAATFLQEVLTIAHEEEIYSVPPNCPQPGP